MNHQHELFPAFSPTKFPYSPNKTASTPNTGHIAVTFVICDRHIGVFKI